MSKKNFHFDISERKILLRILDIVSVLLLLHLVGNIFHFDYFMINTSHWSWSIVLSIYLTVFATIFELYDLQKASRFHKVIKNVILTASLTVLFYLFTPFFTPSLPGNRLQIVYFFVAIIAALLVWRYAYIFFISAPRFNKRILLMAPTEQLEKIVDSLYQSDPNYKVIGFLDVSKTQKEPKTMANIRSLDLDEFFTLAVEMSISEIVVCTLDSEGMTNEVNHKLIRLLEKGVTIRDYIQVYEEMTYRIPVQRVERDFYRYFPFSRNNQNTLYLFFSKILDMFVSIMGLLLCVILLPFLLLGNVLGNRGPLFYKQTRVGKNGAKFKLYKLRSMVVNAEEAGAQYAQVKDVRVTKFGRFLRNSRLDEVPQFINVLKGEMSIIGPRPERPEFVNGLIEKLPFYEVRHLVKPGITGWAQVKARYGSSEEDSLEKLQYDLYYIKHRSLFLDIAIILKTLSTIVFYRGQ